MHETTIRNAAAALSFPLLSSKFVVSQTPNVADASRNVKPLFRFRRHLCLRLSLRVSFMVFQELHRSNERKSALFHKVMRPENAEALSTIEKIDELMAMQGRRLVVEFNQADINHSGGVRGKLQGKPQAAHHIDAE